MNKKRSVLYDYPLLEDLKLIKDVYKTTGILAVTNKVYIISRNCTVYTRRFN